MVGADGAAAGEVAGDEDMRSRRVTCVSANVRGRLYSSLLFAEVTLRGARQLPKTLCHTEQSTSEVPCLRLPINLVVDFASSV
jgi:hypothetical protein